MSASVMWANRGWYSWDPEYLVMRSAAREFEWKSETQESEEIDHGSLLVNGDQSHRTSGTHHKPSALVRGFHECAPQIGWIQSRT
jgi:hypothetical protein